MRRGGVPDDLPGSATVPVDSARSGLDRPGWARTDGVRAISEQRLVGTRPLGTATDGEAEETRTHPRMMTDP